MWGQRQLVFSLCLSEYDHCCRMSSGLCDENEMILTGRVCSLIIHNQVGRNKNWRKPISHVWYRKQGALQVIFSWMHFNTCGISYSGQSLLASKKAKNKIIETKRSEGKTHYGYCKSQCFVTVMAPSTLMIGSTYTFVHQAEKKWDLAQLTPAFSLTAWAPALVIFIFANNFWLITFMCLRIAIC